MRLWMLAMTVAIFPISAIAAPVVQGVASVIDGDTIEIHEKKIRLFGINFPEKGQKCQTAIRKALALRAEGGSSAFGLDRSFQHLVRAERHRPLPADRRCLQQGR